MVPNEAFGKDEAEKAMAELFRLQAAGDVAAADAARVGARLGNHSAMRQWGVKQGFIKAKDADEDALARALKKAVEAADAELEEMAAKKGKKP